MAYYFLTASLPPLTMDGPAPFTPEDFLFSNQAQLSEKDLTILERVVNGVFGPTDHRALKIWLDGEYQLINALTRLRAAELKTNPEPYLQEFEGFDVTIETVAVDAMNMENPLERERILDRFRWRRLDELASADPFGFTAILAFILKLKIVERWRGIDLETGRKNLNNIIDTNVESVAEGKGGQ